MKDYLANLGKISPIKLCTRGLNLLSGIRFEYIQLDSSIKMDIFLEIVAIGLLYFDALPAAQWRW